MVCSFFFRTFAGKTIKLSHKMMTKTTKPTSARCLWQQGFRDAIQRLSVTLMLVMLTASVWAQVFPQTIYRLSLNANYQGGAIGMVDVLVSDPTYTLTSNDEPTREGYIFCGWSESPTGVVKYATGDQVTLTGNLTLYAIWAKESCTVTFYANGGTGTMPVVTTAGGTEFEIPSCGFSYNEGYFCAGWATSADGEIVYHPRDKITLTDDLTLYAKWLDVTISGTCGHVSPQTGLTGSEVTWRLTHSEGSDGYDLLTISSSIDNGVIADYGDGGSPWYAYREEIKTIVIGDRVQTIGDRAFKDCTGVNSVSFGNSVNAIFRFAFSNCTSLTSVTLPSSVRYIHDFAFFECTSLTSVTIFAPKLNWYGGDAFVNNADGRKIYVFNDCVETYKSEWSKYANAIEAIPALAVRDAGNGLGSWCTYYNGLADVTVAEGTTVYTAKQNNAGGVTLTETGSRVIKRGEAVLLKSTANIVLSSAADSGTGTYTGNELKGVDYETAQDANTTYYVLSKVNGIFGFYKLARENNNSEPIKLGANKAYLAVATPPSSAPAYLGFDVDGENTTSLREIGNEESEFGNADYYTLDGRKLSHKPSAKGIYVKNGRKFIIK